MVPKEAWASGGVIDRLNTGAFGEQGTVLSLYNTPRYNKDNLNITGSCCSSKKIFIYTMQIYK